MPQQISPYESGQTAAITAYPGVLTPAAGL